MGPREVAVARRQIEIDRDKLRAAVRKLPDEYVLYMLDDAIDQLPTSNLHTIVRKYLDLRRLRPDSEKANKAGLLADVKAFERTSLAGEYYESFDVNSKNYMQKSKGTTSWIAECHRLLARCVDQAETADPAEVRRAFDIIFGLLDRIDECRDDIIFFADEAGAWQVGVHWEKVLPPWFKVLSSTAEPEEYVQRIVGLLKRHYGYRSAKMLAVARKIATPSQRQALPKSEAAATPSRTRSLASTSPASPRPSAGHGRTAR